MFFPSRHHHDCQMFLFFLVLFFVFKFFFIDLFLCINLDVELTLQDRQIRIPLVTDKYRKTGFCFMKTSICTCMYMYEFVYKIAFSFQKLLFFKK